MKDFDVDKKMLGEGRFGRVFRVRHRGSRKICVLKAMEKSAILAEDVLSQLKREVEVHTRLKHPHIIECYGHFQDNDRRELTRHAGALSVFRALPSFAPCPALRHRSPHIFPAFCFIFLQCTWFSSTRTAACCIST